MPTDTTIIDRLRAVSSCGLFGEAADALTAAHAARDAAEQKLAWLTAHPICLLSDYKAMRDERDQAQAEHTREVLLRAVDKHEINTLRAQLTIALRERDEARAATWDAALEMARTLQVSRDGVPEYSLEMFRHSLCAVFSEARAALEGK